MHDISPRQFIDSFIDRMSKIYTHVGRWGELYEDFIKRGKESNITRVMIDGQWRKDTAGKLLIAYERFTDDLLLGLISDCDLLAVAINRSSLGSDDLVGEIRSDLITIHASSIPWKDAYAKQADHRLSGDLDHRLNKCTALPNWPQSNEINKPKPLGEFCFDGTPSIDARKLLDAHGVAWKTVGNLNFYHHCASSCLHATSHFIGMMALDDMDDNNHQLPEATRENIISNLFTAVVEHHLFPDILPKDKQDWEGCTELLWEYVTRTKQRVLSGVRTFSMDDPWSLREAIRAAWNLELAEVADPATIGAFSSDSSHRVAGLAAFNLWMQYSRHVDIVQETPERQAESWNQLIAAWPSNIVQNHIGSIQAKLARELRMVRAECGFDATPPTQVHVANWDEGAKAISEAIMPACDSSANDAGRERGATTPTAGDAAKADASAASGTVAERLERWRAAGEAFTSQRKMADRLGCSISAVGKALKNTDALTRWGQSNRRPPKRKDAEPLQGKVLDDLEAPADEPIDDYPRARIDTTLAVLIDQANAVERAEINAMSEQDKRRLAVTYLDQQADDEPSPVAAEGRSSKVYKRA